MSKGLFWALFLFCTIFNSVAKAHLHPNPGHFGIQGEFLYLRPSPTAFNFAAELVEFTLQDFTVKSFFNENRYKLGYRVEGIYAIDCLNNINARFTYFNSGSNRQSAEGIFISPAQFIGIAEDNNKFRYYATEVLFGRWLFDCRYFNLELLGGILYSNIRYNEITQLTETESMTPVVVPSNNLGITPGALLQGPSTATRTVQSKFWGIGPELVLNFEYHFPFRFLQAFSFAADARGALLSSKTEAFFDGSSEVFITILNDPFRGVVPASDFRLGLNWACHNNCVKVNLEAGYEWIFYHRAFGASNISFRGPYFVLGADY